MVSGFVCWNNNIVLCKLDHIWVLRDICRIIVHSSIVVLICRNEADFSYEVY